MVLFGPNAAGKSNLLDGLHVLSRLATERTVADALEPPVRGYPAEAFTLPQGGGLPALLDEDSVSFQIEAIIRPAQEYPTNPHCNPLRYRVAIELTPQTGDLVVLDEYLSRLRQDLKEMGNEHPRIQTTSENVIVRQRGGGGRPIQEPLRQNHTKLSDKRYFGEQFPDIEYLRSELGHWRTYYLDPRTAMREPRPPGEVEDIGPTGAQLSQFLYRLKNHPEYSHHFFAMVRAVRSVIPSVDEIDVQLDRQRGVVDVWIRQYGTPFSIRVVSEGTLRVLALACIALNPWPGSLIAFEEPENGVHPRRLEIVADLLCAIAANTDRQVVVTTHSPKLASLMLAKRDDLRWVELVVCDNQAGMTSFKSFDTYGPLFEDKEIRAALTSKSEDGLFDEMLMRGWFGG